MASNCRKVAASERGHPHDAAIGEDHFERAGLGRSRAPRARRRSAGWRGA